MLRPIFIILCASLTIKYFPSAAPILFLDEPEGQKLFVDIQLSATYFQPILWKIFTEQKNRGGCGITSCVLALSANRIGHHYKSVDCQKLSMMSFENIKASNAETEFYNLPETRRIVSQIQTNFFGTTLGQVGSLLRSHGATSHVIYANESSPTQFREDSITALSSCTSERGIIVNFDRRELNTTRMSPSFHHSPIVAYHKQADRVLILDTARPLKEHFWVTIMDLFRAMSTIDLSSRRTRGYCLYSKT